MAEETRIQLSEMEMQFLKRASERKGQIERRTRQVQERLQEQLQALQEAQQQADEQLAMVTDLIYAAKGVPQGSRARVHPETRELVIEAPDAADPGSPGAPAKAGK